MKGNIIFLEQNNQRVLVKGILLSYNSENEEFDNGFFFESKSISETRLIRDELFGIGVVCTVFYLNNIDGSMIYDNIEDPERIAKVKKILLQKTKR